VERANEVLARGRVDCGLSAYARIDLRQQRCGQLDELAAALENGGGKAGEIANHAAPKRQHMIAALDAQLQQPVHCRGQRVPGLGLFACRQHAPMRLVRVIAQPGFDHIAPGGMDIRIGDDRDIALAQQAPAIRHEFGKQACLDSHFVRAASHVNRDHSHESIPSRILRSVSACGPLPL
jgi:hypothetical protein